MQNTKLGLIEIDSQYVGEWKKWGVKLMGELRAGAIETLKEEGLTQEHMFLIELDGKTYLGFFTEGEGEPANLEKEINQKHRALLDKSRIRKISGEQIYPLSI